MKFFATILSLGFLAVAAAQNIVIGSPADGDTISAGQNITVQVERPVRLPLLLSLRSHSNSFYLPFFHSFSNQDSLTGSIEVAVVISIAPCAGSDISTCANPADRLGARMYSGPFDPEFPTTNGATANAYHGPQQNFTVAVPSSLTSGNKAVLSVVHLSLVGVSSFSSLSSSRERSIYRQQYLQAGPFPLYEIKNVTLNIA